MQSGTKHAGWLRLTSRGLLALVALYLLLLIPESAPTIPQGAGKSPFLWRRDVFWKELEQEFRLARGVCADLNIRSQASDIWLQLNSMNGNSLPPNAPEFAMVETNFFLLAPVVGAFPDQLQHYLTLYTKLRRVVKQQSEHWPASAPESRAQLYRLLYGARAALEEAMLQAPRKNFPALLMGDDEPSATPSAMVQGVRIHSGDILVSRGGAATSALIARGNDFPGNFSHVALAHIDEHSKKVSVIEAHIESGVGVRDIEAYLAETKLRIMLLRPRADLPTLATDPMLPHKAATHALNEAARQHIPYDFPMDHTDPSKQFCSEVAGAAYKSQNVTLWPSLSHLSTPGVVSWLSALGVRNFETQEPADLEYDPQLRVVAEWRDPETLFKDHVDNAVIDVMLEGAERGEKLDYNLWMLPFARLAKIWSVGKNLFGGVGPIPEGMSAATALRVDGLKQRHAAMVARVMQQAEQFKTKQGYTPPYWELMRMAREASNLKNQPKV